jgi:membrane protease YdiL (CAAX protease family)
MLAGQLAALLALSCVGLLALTGRLNFIAEEFGDRVRRIVATLLLSAVLTACVFYPALSSDQARLIDPTNLQLPDLFLGHAVLAAFLIVWWRLRRPQPLPRFLFLEPWVWNDIGRGIWLGAMGWVATILVTAAVAAVVTQWQVPDEVPQVPGVMVWIATLPAWQKLAIIAVAMTIEEGFFRAFLQSRIGLIPSSLLFALGHASYGLPLMIVSVLVISLVMGWSFRRTGRLLPAIMAHGTFDAIQLFVILPFAVRQLQNELWDTLAVGSMQ